MSSRRCNKDNVEKKCEQRRMAKVLKGGLGRAALVVWVRCGSGLQASRLKSQKGRTPR